MIFCFIDSQDTGLTLPFPGSPYKTMQVYNLNKLHLMASVNR